MYSYAGRRKTAGTVRMRMLATVRDATPPRGLTSFTFLVKIRIYVNFVYVSLFASRENITKQYFIAGFMRRI